MILFVLMPSSFSSSSNDEDDSRLDKPDLETISANSFYTQKLQDKTTSTTTNTNEGSVMVLSSNEVFNNNK